MTSVIWSPQALLDLQSIRDYIAHDSPRYADLVVHRLVAAVERLEAFPQSGRVVPERNDEAIREVKRALSYPSDPKATQEMEAKLVELEQAK